MNGSNPSRQTRVISFLGKVSRASAYALLAGIAVLILSGWGITQTGIIYKITLGLVDRRVANAIHRAVNTPVALFFLLHVMLNFRLKLTNSHPVKTWFIDGSLIIIGVCLMGIVIYMEYFRLGG